ncbi:unnamed protein product, partial [Polarella glacialis]
FQLKNSSLAPAVARLRRRSSMTRSWRAPPHESRSSMTRSWCLAGALLSLVGDVQGVISPSNSSGGVVSPPNSSGGVPAFPIPFPIIPEEADPFARKCGDKVYIKDAQGCCEKVNNDTGPPEVYGLRTQNCCNGTVYHANRYACCTRHDKSQILYNPLTQNCCIDPAVKNSHRNVHGGLCEIKKGKRSCCIPLKSQVFHRRRRRRHHPHYDLERKSEVGINLSLDQGDAEADHLEEDGSADDCTGAAKFGMDSKLCFAGSRL